MMLLKSDVPPLEDMSGLIDQLNKLHEEVLSEHSVVTSTKTEDTQAKKTPETILESTFALCYLIFEVMLAKFAPIAMP